ncbi:hypothetical protein [Saltatorellus ferox]
MMYPKLAGPLAPVVLCALASCAATEIDTSGMLPSPSAEPHRVAEPPRAAESQRSMWADSKHRVHGTVVDPSGAAIAAKVALVSDRGSSSTSVSDGSFELGTNSDFPVTLCAWTKAGKIGWRILETPPGDQAVTLEVSEDGAFLTLVAGSHDDRVSILSDNIPLNNVKFPSGKSLEFVVPAGDVSFGTVGTQEHAPDRRSARMVPGSSMTVSF